MPWMPEVFTAPIAEARRTRKGREHQRRRFLPRGIMADEPSALVRSFAGHHEVQPHERDPEPDLLDHPRAGRDAHWQPYQADQQEQPGAFLHSVRLIWRSSGHRLHRYVFSGAPPLLIRGTDCNPP